VWGGPAFAVPASLHAPKGHLVEDLQSAMQSNDCHDFAIGEFKQAHKPLAGQFSPSGQPVRLQRGFALKTAVNFDDGRAAEAQLFHYQTLLPSCADGNGYQGRARFGFTVDLDLDGDALARSIELIDGAFFAGIKVGRSRSAEFGFAEVVRAAGAWDDLRTDDVLWGDDGNLAVLALLSDACFVDSFGQPTCRPTPQDLGLSDAWSRVCFDRSFVRTRRWVPFNGKRQRPDSERVALKRGSVLTVEIDTDKVDFDLAAWRERLRVGVGAHRAEGLGQVWLQPLLLRDRQNGLPSKQSAEQRTVAELPNDDLGRWLQHRTVERDSADRAWKDARQRLSGEFRRYQRIGKELPSASQWRIVQRVAIAAGGNQQRLNDGLFGDQGVCTHGTAARRWIPQDKKRDADRLPGAKLKKLVGEARSGMEVCLTVAHLAADMAAGIRDAGRQEGRE